MAAVAAATAVTNDIDDVGFMAPLLDRLEANLCVDRRRAYAAGMSNGAIMSHRLACDLAGRIRAVGSVSGAMMADPCTPVRPRAGDGDPRHGDLNIPYDGGMGCGAAGVPFPSVDGDGLGLARARCVHGATSTLLVQGDGSACGQGRAPAGRRCAVHDSKRRPPMAGRHSAGDQRPAGLSLRLPEPDVLGEPGPLAVLQPASAALMGGHSREQQRCNVRA